jgi:DNA-binding beta-propeller fold protein YncE
MEDKIVAISTRRIPSAVVLLTLLSFLILAGSCRTPDYSSTKPVGEIGPQTYVTPMHQVLTPAGTQVELPGMRPQGLALSPDGRLLATSGKTQQLVLLDPQTGDIKQRVALPSSKAQDPNVVSTQILEPDKSSQLSFTGLVFSPDGSRLYLSNVDGDVKVFSVGSDGQVKGLFSMPLPAADAPRRKQEIPAGLAISRDGRRLYVVLN